MFHILGNPHIVDCRCYNGIAFLNPQCLWNQSRQPNVSKSAHKYRQAVRSIEPGRELQLNLVLCSPRAVRITNHSPSACRPCRTTHCPNCKLSPGCRLANPALITCSNASRFIAISPKEPIADYHTIITTFFPRTVNTLFCNFLDYFERPPYGPQQGVRPNVASQTPQTATQ
jgi:hypothetical protein